MIKAIGYAYCSFKIRVHGWKWCPLRVLFTAKLGGLGFVYQDFIPGEQKFSEATEIKVLFSFKISWIDLVLLKVLCRSKLKRAMHIIHSN